MANKVKLTPSATAVWVKPGAGDVDAPFDTPVSNLDKVIFHSDLDYFEVLARTSSSVTVNHPAVAHTEIPESGGGFQWVQGPNANEYFGTYNLFAHGLGSRPDYFIVVQDGQVLPPGMVVQGDGNGNRRYVTTYATSTHIVLHERVQTRTGTLAAVSRDYDVMVLGVTSPSLTEETILKPDSAKLGKGIIDRTRRYLRAADGSETAYYLTNGKTADLNHGVARVVTPDGTTFDDAGHPTIATLNYAGSFTGPDAFEVCTAEDTPEGSTSKLTLKPSGIEIIDDGSIVFDNERPLIAVIDEISIDNETLTFPDPPDDYRYMQSEGAGIPAPGEPIHYGISCVTLASIKPREWTTTIELATLPVSGLDVSVGAVRLQRTSDPDNVGIYSAGAVTKLVPENQWLNANGTIILEGWGNIRRAVTFAVQGDKLVAILQDSIGYYDVEAHCRIYKSGEGYVDHDDESSTDDEFPVRIIDSDSYTSTNSGNRNNRREGRSQQLCSTSFAWAWGSVWQADIRIAVGKVLAQS